MISKKKSILTIAVLVLFSIQVIGYSQMDSSGKKSVELNKVEKEFYVAANKLIDEEEFADAIELSDEYIRNDPTNAMYHQFKGLALVLKYADDILPLLTCKSCIKNAVQEFQIARTLDTVNEDRALAGVVLAYVVYKELDKAKEVFEPAIKKYPGSIYLNYVGIKYYEKTGDKSSSLMCKNFVAKNNPVYNGKPVFGGISLVITVATLVKVLTAAVIISFISGFKSGMKVKL
jgi:tetratricopeptide (TPR) repeat protein